MPVDEDGVSVDALDRTDADALVLTPSHQWPTGAVLSAERRAAVLRWARERRALVIEDDYDAEYRYDRAPIGAMQGLAPDLVAYAGTASKTLAPGLRLGWLVVPPRLVDAVADAKKLADRGSPVLDQLAFADFVDRGEFDRHLRRMRPLYRRRRDALLAALRRARPRARAGRDRRRAAPRRLPARRRRRDGRRRGRRPPRRGGLRAGALSHRLRGPPGAHLRLRDPRRARARRGDRDAGRGDVRRAVRIVAAFATFSARASSSTTATALTRGSPRICASR